MCRIQLAVVVEPGLVAVAVQGGGVRGSECLPDLLHGHDITDPAAQRQQGDHEGEQKYAHGLNDKAWSGKFPSIARHGPAASLDLCQALTFQTARVWISSLTSR